MHTQIVISWHSCQLCLSRCFSGLNLELLALPLMTPLRGSLSCLSPLRVCVAGLGVNEKVWQGAETWGLCVWWGLFLKHVVSIWQQPWMLSVTDAILHLLLLNWPWILPVHMHQASTEMTLSVVDLQCFFIRGDEMDSSDGFALKTLFSRHIIYSNKQVQGKFLVSQSKIPLVLSLLYR